MNGVYPWTACGPMEGVAGLGQVLTLLLVRLQCSLGLKPFVSSAAAATIEAYIPYSYQAF